MKDADAGDRRSRAPLYRGEALRALIESMRPKIEEQSRRLLSKGRGVPGIRVADYIGAQASPAIRQALERLVAGRPWRYVAFAEFLESLTRLARRLFDDVANARMPGTPVCFVVDSLRKSSFWVVAVALIAIKPASYANLSLAIDDDGAAGGLYAAFRELPPTCRLVLMDDATYSGDQLSYFHDLVVDQWRDAHGRSARVHVAVPFMSLPSVPLFKRRAGTKLMLEETFNSLFHRRTLSTVLAADVYLVRKSAIITEHQSLFFDFLGVLPTNTLIIFEHKVADSLSIPNRWLQLGPCLQPDAAVDAWRVRPDRASELVQLLRRDLRERRGSWSAPPVAGGPGSASQRLMLTASRRVAELLGSARFRAQFAERVSLTPDRPAPPAFLPLIPPDFCDPKYRRYVMTRLRRASGVASGMIEGDMPPCRRPPYKRSSFRRRIVRQA
jgi:hypothetical protein